MKNKMRPALALSLILFLILFSGSAFPRNPSQSHQNQALTQLKKEVAVAILQRHPSPIQTVLKHHRALDATTIPGRQKSDESKQSLNYLPKNRPAKVNPDEWQVLKKSGIGLEDAENGMGSFTLLDLNEDGVRDLIVNQYSGGTGLYSFVSVYRRVGNRFVNAQPEVSSSGKSGAVLYSINGRGSDQAGEWVRINGRVYLAYRNGEYGKDELILLRAFSLPAKKVKGLVVDYRYRHRLVSPKQNTNQERKKPEQSLSDNLFAAIQNALSRIQNHNDHERSVGSQCPVPANLPPEKREQYAAPWFGPGYYTFEVVADFPVYQGNQCYEARLASFKNSYLLPGHYMETALWLLRSPDSEVEEYDVHSTRIPQRVRAANLDYPFTE